MLELEAHIDRYMRDGRWMEALVVAKKARKVMPNAMWPRVKLDDARRRTRADDEPPRAPPASSVGSAGAATSTAIPTLRKPG